MKDNSSFNVDSYKKFKDLGVNVLDPKDSFFNEICYPYSQSGDDLILEDRREDIYQNFSLCENDCTFIDINVEDRTIICDCIMKENHINKRNHENPKKNILENMIPIKIFKKFQIFNQGIKQSINVSKSNIIA